METDIRRGWRRVRGARIALALLGLGLAACNTVPFYEKGNLSDPALAFEEDASEVHFRQKVLYSREGAIGGIGTTAGGGCGCY